jgi:tRNA (guanine37-N1)-methyltransferase
MIINILTGFPEYFDGTFCSLFRKAIKNNILAINVYDLKKYGVTKHNKIDDVPFGGGGGMILRPEIIEHALEEMKNNSTDISHSLEMQHNQSTKKDKNGKYKSVILLTSPRGIKLNQKLAKKLSSLNEITIICNRYAGVDQRAIDYYDLQEICTGDYILTGGETAAMAVIESVSRLLPGFIKNEECKENETFSRKGFISHDHYTKPRIWNGTEVPSVLRNGDHQKIAKWKEDNSAGKKRQQSLKIKYSKIRK